MAKRDFDVVYNNREGVTCIGNGPHRGKPVYLVPQRYIDWCLGNLPYALLLRQVMEAEDVRRRVDGWKPEPVKAANRLNGDIVGPTKKRPKGKTKRWEKRRTKQNARS
jgi:hypothetical protein